MYEWKESLLDFYKDKKILITGHTGFKGSWLSEMLLLCGADVLGYALEPPTAPSLFEQLQLDKRMQSVVGDVRDYELLHDVIERTKPEVIFHLAAQPIVRESYVYPRETYETNVMGTVNILEAVRNTTCVKSLVNVTTDKVYMNKEQREGYSEKDELNGYDPYSNSKSCSELVTDSFRKSFFADRKIAISTVRAGNVVGGGDFAMDRILPDSIRAALAGEDIIVRNPYSIRPYQHVLEALAVYLLIARKQYEDITIAGSYNVGPDDEDCLTTGQIVDLFCKEWNLETGKSLKWIHRGDNGPHEANFLKLNCSLLKNTFSWEPIWHMDIAMKKIVQWTFAYATGENIEVVTDRQIRDFFDM